MKWGQGGYPLYKDGTKESRSLAHRAIASSFSTRGEGGHQWQSWAAATHGASSLGHPAPTPQAPFTPPTPDILLSTGQHLL